ncbi:MAG TPA: helical backbone metal receptor [Planctomycetota bacterium]|nr:helical backbone metal receptor [Planctomycetota bacterium]
MDAPARIVCLCPSITEALFAIGAGDRVVGVTEYCVHPQERVADLPKVGGSKVVDLDALFELAPDLVVMNEEENRIEDFEEIRERGIRVLRTFPKTVLDAAPMMRELGRAVACEEEAERVARAIESAAASARAGAKETKRPRVACLVWMRPFMTVNADTFLHDMLDLAGLENVFASRPERYPRLEPAELTGGLDAVLLPNEPFEFVPQHATEIAALAGLPTRSAVLCDGQYLTWYGSRTPDGIAYTVRLAQRVRALPAA